MKKALSLCVLFLGMSADICLLYMLYADSSHDLGLYKLTISRSWLICILLTSMLVVAISLLVINYLISKIRISVRLKIAKHTSFFSLSGILVFVIIIVNLLLLPPTYNKLRTSYIVEESIDRLRYDLRNSKYIIHAGGLIDNGSGNEISYTNSLEALLNCYKSENRFCELDFSVTTDNKLVCVHDWDQIYVDGKQLSNPVSLNEFLHGKVYDSFTTISLDDLAEFLQENNDFKIVTDVKDDNYRACKIIADSYPNLRNNFIVQIYDPSEYNDIHSLGFDYIIFTLYRQERPFRTRENILKSVSDMNLVGITCWYNLYDEPDFYEILTESDTAIFVHTVNDSDECNRYFQKGVCAIYTDMTKF